MSFKVNKFYKGRIDFTELTVWIDFKPSAKRSVSMMVYRSPVLKSEDYRYDRSSADRLSTVVVQRITSYTIILFIAHETRTNFSICLFGPLIIPICSFRNRFVTIYEQTEN